MNKIKLTDEEAMCCLNSNMWDDTLESQLDSFSLFSYSYSHNELHDELDPQKYFIELGAGKGSFIKHIARKVYRCDPPIKSSWALIEPLREIAKDIRQDVLSYNSGISPQVFNDPCLEANLRMFYSDSIDGVFSFQSLHRFNNREMIFDQVHRILKDGQNFVIADVTKGTQTQKFFDDVIRKHNTIYYNFNFVDKEEICKLAGSKFELNGYLIRPNLWGAVLKRNIALEVKMMFGLNIPHEEVLDGINEHFNLIERAPRLFHLPWELGYYSLQKK